MKTLGTHNYFVYITTNKIKSVLYTGVTNDLVRRIYEHEQDALTDKKHFTGKYKAVYLVYWERHTEITYAIEREKEIKGKSRRWKEELINEFNPKWTFLNKDLE